MPRCWTDEKPDRNEKAHCMNWQCKSVYSPPSGSGHDQPPHRKFLPIPRKVMNIPRTARSRTAAAHIARMVKQIVKKLRPQQIILFGSHARSEAGPDRDVDLLVVMPVPGSVREMRQRIRGAQQTSTPTQALLDGPSPYKRAWYGFRAPHPTSPTDWGVGV
jgi:uncharacterized protein